MDFFEEKKELDSSSIVEHIFGEFEINNILNYIYCKISKNGGLFFITQNFKLKEEIFFKRDPELKNNIKVFNSDGNFLNKIPISNSVVEIDFLENEKIIVIDNFGRFKIYNPYCEITNENTFENSLPKNLEKIKLARYKKNSIFFVTDNFNIYLLLNLEKPKKILLLNDKNLIPENLEEDFFDYFYNKNNNDFTFFISCKEKGLLIITFNKDEKKLDKKIILNENRIKKVILSPSKKMLAYLTSDYTLTITDTKFTKSKKIILKLTETEKNQLQLKWLSNSGIVTKTNSKLDFILSAKKKIKKIFDSGINSEKNILILESETDGLRVLKIKKITSTRYFCENILIRKICPFYENVKNIISFSPGNNLYTSYKSFLKELPPNEKDIINEPLELIKGIKEIVFCVKFEIDEKKQRKFLKCLNFGKLFINGNDKIDRNVVFDVCNDIKSWVNVKFCNNRFISFLEFEFLIRNEFNEFVSILVNSENFFFAFYLAIFKNNRNLIKKIFLEYTESLLKKNLSDKQISENILNSFNYIKKNVKNFDSAILIKIANKCYEKNRYNISEELLKYDNPIILKITSFLKMKQYYKALEQALLINDSNALYLIFYKIFQTSDIDKKKLFNQNIINSKNQILIDHYHHFLEIEKNMFFNHFCNLIKNPNDFFIKNNYRINLINNINKALNFIKTNIELLEDTKTLFKKKKDFIFGHILTFYKILENDIKSSNFINYDISIFKNLNSYNILLPYFLKEKHNYLYNPNFPFSKKILEICKKLNISVKLLFLKRINFMINYLEEKDFFQIIKFLQIHQKKFSLIQLHMFFFNLNKSDFFLKILEIFQFSNTYDLLFDKQLFYEAAYLAQFNNNQTKFLESFAFIQSLKRKKELQEITKGKFK